MAAGDVAVNVTRALPKRCAVFDGVDDVINVTAPADVLELNDSQSISFWIKPSITTAGTDNKGVFARRNSGAFVSYSMANNGNNLKIRVNDGTHNVEQSISGLLETWNHIVIVINGFNATGLQAYLNGVAEIQVDISSITSLTTSNNIKIGAEGSNFYGGCISDMQLWNRALTPTEAIKVYQGSLVTDGLIHRWKLADDYTDSVGSADGTNSGSRLAAIDDQVAVAVKAARALGGATDNFMICDLNNKIMTAVVEET